MRVFHQVLADCLEAILPNHQDEVRFQQQGQGLRLSKCSLPKLKDSSRSLFANGYDEDTVIASNPTVCSLMTFINIKESNAPKKARWKTSVGWTPGA